MQIRLWQVDAFARRRFEGNPAAVVPLEHWLDDELMQRIANENNLAETAFFVPRGTGRYALRWFTPTVEADLCGHATLASAWVLFEELATALTRVEFETCAGILTVDRGADGRHVMSLPSDRMHLCTDSQSRGRQIAEAFGVPAPRAVYDGRDLMAVFDNAATVRAIRGPGDIGRAIPHDKCLIVTAAGVVGYDFISRYFAPHHGIPEDPVTGSAHSALAPFWAQELGKSSLKARQVSPRGGDLDCRVEGDRTIVSGPCALYMRGEISL